MAENSESIPSAIVKGYNQDKDLAVIAVSLKDIPAEVLGEIKVAVIGDSSAIKAGDRVVAIGNALGYGQSVTTGIVSAVNRRITGETNDGTIDNTFIQTDAAINFGNSGGALLNMYGEVIGINSAKISASGVEGMGYAIPITDVENIIDELMVKKTRKVVDENKQGFLGITGRDVSSAVSESFGIPMGVYVDSVTKGLGAEKAGIKKGYIICTFDGYTITSIAQLQDRLTYYSAGEEVDVLVKIPSGENGYKEKIIKVKLSNKSKNIDKVEKIKEKAAALKREAVALKKRQEREAAVQKERQKLLNEIKEIRSLSGYRL
jgi:serine protease Do